MTETMATHLETNCQIKGVTYRPIEYKLVVGCWLLEVYDWLSDFGTGAYMEFYFNMQVTIRNNLGAVWKGHVSSYCVKSLLHLHVYSCLYTTKE